VEVSDVLPYRISRKRNLFQQELRGLSYGASYHSGEEMIKFLTEKIRVYPQKIGRLPVINLLDTLPKKIQ
jgi:hypothetical protein